jgi:hypothetical protein
MLEQIVSQQKGESREGPKKSSGPQNPDKPVIVRFFVEKAIPEQVS